MKKKLLVRPEPFVSAPFVLSVAAVREVEAKRGDAQGRLRRVATKPVLSQVEGSKGRKVHVSTSPSRSSGYAQHERWGVIAEAMRMQKAAARQGFDWTRSAPLWDKLHEEIGELREVARDHRRAQEELGDLLFMVVNLARHYRLNPERALAAGNAKFRRRYAYIQKHAAKLPPLGHRRRLAEMEKLWQKAKRQGL